MGEVYALRKDDPLYFSLKRAEYTTALVRTGDQYTVPKADNKLLVLHFTLQNPGTREQLVRFDTLQFGAFDAANVVHPAQGSWGIESTHAPLETSLQPGQKIEGYTTINVPAKGAISRLHVASGGADPLLGYDLRIAENKVAALPAPIADPNDGATARALVPGALNANYPYEQFTATVEKFEYITTALLDEAPPEGGRYLVCTFLVKNVSTQSAILRFDTFDARCISEEGEEMRLGSALLLATTNRRLEQAVKPGEELRARMYFSVPKGALPKTLFLRQGESREYRFPVSSGTRELEVPRITLPGG